MRRGYCRAGDEAGALYIERRRESGDLKLACLLLHWPKNCSGRPSWQVPRKCLLELRVRTENRVRRNAGEDDPLDLLETRAEGKRRSQQMI